MGLGLAARRRSPHREPDRRACRSGPGARTRRGASAGARRGSRRSMRWSARSLRPELLAGMPRRLLRQSEAQLHTTLRDIGDAVLSTDADGVVRFMNRAAEALIGWRLDEVEGRPLDNVAVFLNEASGERVDNPVARLIRDGTVGSAAHRSDHPAQPPRPRGSHRGTRGSHSG